jgi:(p)ppGpp synthase/HD superfamily hydrolase
MYMRSAEPTEGPAAVAEQRWARAERERRADLATAGHVSPLARAALAFAVRCHDGQQRNSDGAAFVEHPLEVARLLRGAGCSDVLVAAGLLHDVLEDSHVSVVELTERFGADVAGLVQAVSDDTCVRSYRQRKQMLCEQVRNTGGDAALLFCADKISKLRELPDQVTRDRGRFHATAHEHRARSHLEHYQQMRLEHYQQSLAMLQRVVPRHPLVKQLADELRACPIRTRHDTFPGRPARESRGAQAPD